MRILHCHGRIAQNPHVPTIVFKHLHGSSCLLQTNLTQPLTCARSLYICACIDERPSRARFPRGQDDVDDIAVNERHARAQNRCRKIQGRAASALGTLVLADRSRTSSQGVLINLPMLCSRLLIRSSILRAPESSSFARNPIASYEFVANPSLGD